MNRRLYAPAVLLVGLLTTQIVATAHVYRSNLHLQRAVATITGSGYLAVPNAAVAEQLGGAGIALAGGLLFAFSIGAGLSLITLIAVWGWDRLFHRRRKALAGGLLAWGVALALINANGWDPAATAYLVVVPLVTAVAALRMLPGRTTLLTPAGVLWPTAAALLLAGLWSLVLDRHLFTDVRDHLLLESRIGRAITDAYYTYTLFPAEAFKSLSQKQQRTCVLDTALDHTSWTRLERALRSRDYLPIAAHEPTDLTVEPAPEGDAFALRGRRHRVISIPAPRLFAHTDDVLSEVSQAMDRHRPLRILTLVGLLLGLPLVLFTLLYCALGTLPDLVLPGSLSDGISAALCVVAGAALLWPVYQGRSHATVIENPATALADPSMTTRLAALKQACADGQDIFLDARRHNLYASTHVSERYWLARSLAFSQHPDALPLLLTMADDPVPIVACQALWALGQRGDRTQTATLINHIATSTHWYVQMYAYRALRTLGWTQPPSPLVSYSQH